MTARRLASSARVGLQAGEEGADVLDAVLALERAVVEPDEALAIAGRAADVGEEDGDALLVEEVIVAAHEAGARLAFGAAVDVDDQRALAGEFARVGAVEEARHGLAVEALHLDQLGLDVDVGVEAAGLALGPAGQLERRGIERISVGRALGRVQGQAERAPRRELEPADGPGGDRVDAADAAAGDVEQRQAGRCRPRW